MSTSKQHFGWFVAERRRAAGYTQKELAALLHVTESAVSKWERGLSYPDITVVPRLAQQLGVSSDELISASENPEERGEQNDARVYRRWRASLLWSTSIAYALAIITSFIVNLSAQHTLSWFWVVLAAVAFACSLTTLPMLRLPHRGWLVLGASLVSLLALLGIIALLFGAGAWVSIAMASVVLAAVLCFGPIWVAVVSAIIGVFSFVLDPTVDRVLGTSEPRLIDLTQWSEAYVSGNIEMLVLVGCILVALVLGIAAAARAAARRQA